MNDIMEVWPLSPLQQGLFALNQLSPDHDPYHVQFTFRIEGLVDKLLLKDSIISMLHRYPNLKAAFFAEDLDYPIQIIPQEIELRWQEKFIVEAITILDNDSEVLQLAKLEFSKPFDLAEGNLFRFLLVTDNEKLHYLILTAHHIVIDGWSLPIFFQELMNIYLLGNRLDLLEEAPNYRDYVVWLEQNNKEKILNRWIGYLKDLKQPTLLSDKVKVVSSEFGIPLRCRNNLSLDETQALQTWCQEHQLTITSVFLMAWAYRLGSIKNEDDVVFGLTISGRPSEITNIDTMIGLFINTIPCRVILKPYKSLLEQVQDLQSELVEMRDNGVVGITDIQRAIKMDSLFDSLVIFQNTPVSSENVFDLNGARVTALNSFDSTHYPITLVCAVVDGQLILEVEVRRDQDKLINGLELVDAILHFLKMVPKCANQCLGSVQNNINNVGSEYYGCGGFQYPHDNVGKLFAENVTRLASQEALILAQLNQPKKVYTWLELDQLVRKIVTLIKNYIDIRVVPCRAGIILPRNEYFIASIFACTYLNITIVPFDYTTPKNRISSIARSASLTLLITDQDGLVDDVATLNLARFDFEQVKADRDSYQSISIDQELYIIFTSGSTGVPKGVVGLHRGVLTLIQAYQHLLTEDFNGILRIGHAWSFAFDASWQPLSMFLMGHTLVLLDEDIQRDPDLFVRSIEQYLINVIETSPTMIRQIDYVKRFQESLTSLKILGLGGEAIDRQLWQQLSRLENITLFNFYGPTETTVDAVVANIVPNTTPMIGKPLLGLKAEVLDSWLRPCSVGMVGELYLSGDQIAQGYLNDPVLTGCRFVAGHNGLRRYRTGDLVSINAEGNLIYHGRADNQVKVRGFRVEAKDIEQHLLLDDRVDACMVFPICTEIGLRLAAAVILKKHHVQDKFVEKSILNQLRLRAPHYLIPHYIVCVKKFPMTINGKLDIKALPRSKSLVVQEPSTEIEIKLAKLVRKVLSLVEDFPLDVDEDLRYYGLDSIMVMQLANRIQQEGYAITPRMIMQFCSIRAIADKLSSSLSCEKMIDNYQEVVLTPIMCWLLQFKYWQRFCQWIAIRIPDSYDETVIRRHFQKIIAVHPMLRVRVYKDKQNFFDSNIIFQSITDIEAKDWLQVQRKSLEKSSPKEITQVVENAVSVINPEEGINFNLIWFPEKNNLGGHLIILIHHLVVDGVSWRVLVDDFKQLECDESSIMPEITSFASWSQWLQKRSQTEEVRQLLPKWQNYLSSNLKPIGCRLVDKHNDLAINSLATTLLSSVQEMEILVQLRQHHISIEHVLIATLLAVVYQFYKANKKIKENELFELLIDCESHGREEKILSEYGEIHDDISRTMGWYTVVSPIKFSITDDADIFMRFRHIKQQMLQTPSDSLDYSLLYNDIPSSGAEIEFNYHGFLDTQKNTTSCAWNVLSDRKVLDSLPEVTEPLLNRCYALEVNAAILADSQGNHKLTTRFNVSTDVFSEEDFKQLITLWQSEFSDTCQKISCKLAEFL